MPTCITLTLTEQEWTSPTDTQVPIYNSCHILNRKLIHRKKKIHLLTSHQRKGTTVVVKWFIASRPIRGNDAQVILWHWKSPPCWLLETVWKIQKEDDCHCLPCYFAGSVASAAGHLWEEDAQLGYKDLRHSRWEPFKVSQFSGSHLIQCSVLNF